MQPVVINIVSSRSGAGKTTVMEKLLVELTGRGLRVAALKGEVDRYNLDVPGKDTWRFATAGASITGMTTPHKYILIGTAGPEGGTADAVRLLREVDLVLVEGDRQSANPKIEVVREAVSPESLLPDNLFAVATDVKNLAAPAPVFSLDNTRGLAGFIMERFFPGPVKAEAAFTGEETGKVDIVKASPVDREDILHLGKQFTDDYLEYVADRWINQSEGGLYLARRDDTVVACCCLSFPSATEGWLQGMRVHPAYQNQGVAFVLTTHLLNLARAAGAGAIRLLTHPGNEKAIKLARKAGFSITGGPVNVIYLEELRECSDDLAVSANPCSWHPCALKDYEQVLAFVRSSTVFQACGNLLFAPGYMYRTLTGAHLYRLLEQGNVFRVNGETGISGVMIAQTGQYREEILVSFVDAPDEILPSVITLLPRWRQEGFRLVDMSLLPGQQKILQPLLERHLGSLESQCWQIMELK